MVGAKQCGYWLVAAGSLGKLELTQKTDHGFMLPRGLKIEELSSSGTA